MSSIASQITSPRIVFWTVYLDTDQRKHQSSASLAFVQGIHRKPVNSPHKWPSNAENVSIWWRHHGPRHGVLLQQENTLAHTLQVATRAVHDWGFELLSHLRCCQDLPLKDYFLFSKHKKELLGQKYDNDKELMLAVEELCRERGSVVYLEVKVA